MATITHDPILADPIHVAIARHRAAYDAYQVALEGAPSIEANDEYDAASDALVSTPCATRFGALALVSHLRWWLNEEAEFKAGHQPAYGLAEARVADLTLFVGTPLPPAMRPSVDVLAGFLPQATPAGRLGRSARLEYLTGELMAGFFLICGGAVLTGFASLL